MSEEQEQTDVEADPLAVAGDDPVSSGDRIMAAMTKSDPVLFEQRPRDRMYDYAINRMRAIQVRQEVEGDAMMTGWHREYVMMDDVKNLIEWMERRELEKKIADEKAKNRRSYK